MEGEAALHADAVVTAQVGGVGLGVLQAGHVARWLCVQLTAALSWGNRARWGSRGLSGRPRTPLLAPCLTPAVPQAHPGRNACPPVARSPGGRNRSSHRHSCDIGAGTGAGESPQPSCSGKHIHRGLEDIPEGRVKFLPLGTSVMALLSERLIPSGLKTKSSPGHLELQASLSLFFGRRGHGKGER